MGGTIDKHEAGGISCCGNGGQLSLKAGESSQEELPGRPVREFFPDEP